MSGGTFVQGRSVSALLIPAKPIWRGRVGWLLAGFWLFVRTSHGQMLEAWRRTYNSGGTEHPLALAFDANGNAYLTDESMNATINNNWDFVTVKYSPTGAELWVHRYDGPQHFSDSATALAIAKNGEAWVTGYSFGADSRSTTND